MNEHYVVLGGHDGIRPRPVATGESRACDTLISMALVGALVGGSAAAARNAVRLKRDEIEFGDALRGTGRSALASAAATALAGAVAGVVSNQGLLHLCVMFGVGAAALYGFEPWSDGRGGADA